MFTEKYLFEEWRPVVGYEGRYEVSNYGRVRSLPRKYTNGSILSFSYAKFGYPLVILSMDGKYRTICVHRLVAEAFIPNPDNLPCVNHKDECPQNNYVALFHDGSYDAEHSNLEWCSYSYNLKYGGAVRRMIENRKGYGAEKPVLQYTMDGVLVKKHKSQQSAGLAIGKSQSGISMCITGKRKSAYGYIWRTG